jgi:hypothetical protein
MNRVFLPSMILRFAPLAGLLVAGCAATFSPSNAREVSRERLVELSDAGHSDHILYEGSDAGYHYVFDSRPEKRRSYKVRSDSVKLKDTFPVGEDSYVLHPWVIEGKPFGSRTDEPVSGAPPAEVDR